MSPHGYFQSLGIFGTVFVSFDPRALLACSVKNSGVDPRHLSGILLQNVWVGRLQIIFVVVTWKSWILDLLDFVFHVDFYVDLHCWVVLEGWLERVWRY